MVIRRNFGNPFELLWMGYGEYNHFTYLISLGKIAYLNVMLCYTRYSAFLFFSSCFGYYTALFCHVYLCCTWAEFDNNNNNNNNGSLVRFMHVILFSRNTAVDIVESFRHYIH